MRSTRLLLFLLAISYLMLNSACTRDFIEESDDLAPTDFEEIEVSENFEFSTSQEVQITLSDNETNVRYDIYTLEPDSTNILVASGAPQNGQFQYTLKLPGSVEQLYVQRNATGSFSSAVVNIINKQADHAFTGKSKTKSGVLKDGCFEQLYVVNGQGGFYTINNESGNYEETQLPNLLGGGSIACAVDRANKLCYYNVGQTLYKYDIVAEEFSVVSTSNPFNGNYPRMEYDNTTGMLYIAKDTKMYKLDPLTNQVLATYNIVGLLDPVGGGDLAISLDGTIYMCCFSGLYRIQISGNTATATRISAENLPFQPTSMAIDRNDRLYMGTNDANSQLIEMDKVDGAWQVVKTYNHKINDLGSLPCSLEELSQADDDNDGIINQLDAFPENSELAFEVFTPSELGWGSLAFEDLWPSTGDYDFNDLVVNYRFTSKNNAANQVVELEAKIQVKNIGASKVNGFGFEMPFSPNLIASVTGNNLTDNIITSNPNGTEANQSKAVIIVFDNANKNGVWGTCMPQSNNTLTVLIRFTNPIDPSTLGNPPFNPFIFVDQVRGHEVHLANRTPTDLVDTSLFGEFQDRSDIARNIYYRNEFKHPWAIDIIHNFRVPREKEKVFNAFKRFKDWAVSEGASYSDWYKDNAGYRDVGRICDEN